MINAEAHNNSISRSTSLLNDRHASPLFLAVKAGVSEEVLDVLLRPESFYFEGFDSATTIELAKRINGRSTLRSTLQDHIIERFANRVCFAVLILDLYANAFALQYYLLA